LACATAQFDGTLLYQQHLVGHILRKESGVYLSRVLSYHRLGGIPDFGSSPKEKGRFVPKLQTPDSSLHFMRGMLEIAYSLDDPCGPKVGRRILRDIGNYAYPIISIQSARPFRVFALYILQLMKLGLWRAPIFHFYVLGLLILGHRKCDKLIARVKAIFGRTPIIGKVYVGEVRSKSQDTV
jgi:hypothetical protein